MRIIFLGLGPQVITNKISMVAKEAKKLKDLANSIKVIFFTHLKSSELVEQLFVQMLIACRKVKFEINLSSLNKIL